MKTSQKGFVLIVVLAFLIMMLLGVATILTTTSGNANLKLRALYETRAQAHAEAGMHWAIWNCRENSVCYQAPFREIPIQLPRPSGVTTAKVNWTATDKFTVIVEYSDT